jgi:hypothetical protein
MGGGTTTAARVSPGIWFGRLAGGRGGRGAGGAAGRRHGGGGGVLLVLLARPVDGWFGT